MERLRNGDCWVETIFSDGTSTCIHTSLNARILEGVGAELLPNTFFDLERLQYVKFNEDAIDVILHENKPQFEKEVARFAHRFI